MPWGTKNEHLSRPGADTAPTLASTGPANQSVRTHPARIGKSIRIEGEVYGAEDLLVDGEVSGNIQLEDHSLTIGATGRVEANIHGRSVMVDGYVRGNIFAHEHVLIRAAGEVQGDVVAPRVSLEDGARLKGAIDMTPRPREREADTAPAAGGADIALAGGTHGSGEGE